MKKPFPSGQESFVPWPLNARTLLAAVVVVLLAVGALLLPPASQKRAEALFLVVDPLGTVRGQEAFGPLVDWLVAGTERPLQLRVVSALGEMADQDREAVELVLCPDGVATGLADDRFASLAAGRRHTPHNLRTKSVLVYRLAAGLPQQPGLPPPERSILGDSLSLAGCGVVCRQVVRSGEAPYLADWRRQWVFGPDPYDHGAALHALRLGCFDYAVVRKMAADRFFTAGLLTPERWGLEELTGSLPDVVVLVARSLPAPVRVRLGEILVGLGRHANAASDRERAVLRGIRLVGLDGFNLMFEPEFQSIRRRFDSCWPGGGY